MSGHNDRTRVTREEWVAAARTALVAEGVEHVRVAVLAERLGYDSATVDSLVADGVLSVRPPGW